MLSTGVGIAACASPPPGAHAPTIASSSPAATPVAAPPASSSTADSAPAVRAASTAAPEVELGSWTRELEISAAMLALGKRRVAVLERDSRPGRYRAVWMRDLETGAQWSELTVPERLQPTDTQRERLEVFFGRDDRPRLMGTRREADVATPRYYRFRDGWRDRTGEIARLDGGTGALFGILGHADPEVVCKLGEMCIIKRLTGWTNVSVPGVEHHVAIAGGSAFAVAPGSALRIDPGDADWRAFGEAVPWQMPAGLCPFADGTLWVVEADRLHHWDGTAWQSQDSPRPGARALWGRSPDDVWLVAKGGLGHYDGQVWSRVTAPGGEFSAVIGTDAAVWVGGASGVWVGR